jgi:hypothetical protein
MTNDIMIILGTITLILNVVILYFLSRTNTNIRMANKMFKEINRQNIETRDIYSQLMKYK